MAAGTEGFRLGRMGTPQDEPLNAEETRISERGVLSDRASQTSASCSSVSGTRSVSGLAAAAFGIGLLNFKLSSNFSVDKISSFPLRAQTSVENQGWCEGRRTWAL
jgi:hypothetical protein